MLFGRGQALILILISRIALGGGSQGKAWGLCLYTVLLVLNFEITFFSDIERRWQAICTFHFSPVSFRAGYFRAGGRDFGAGSSKVECSNL